MSARLDLKRAIDKIERLAKRSISPSEMKKIGNLAVKIIVKRTRLGYGVKSYGGTKKSLKSMRRHKPSYTLHRQRYSSKLSSGTTPRRVNQTYTGQMLDSMRVVRFGEGTAVIGPFGKRKEGTRNEVVANANAKRGWKWNNLTRPETSQILRFYRKNLRDLLKRNLT